jgi:hypothetical protein
LRFLFFATEIAPNDEVHLSPNRFSHKKLRNDCPSGRWHSMSTSGRLIGLLFRRFDRYDSQTGKRSAAQGHAVSKTRRRRVQATLSRSVSGPGFGLGCRLSCAKWPTQLGTAIRTHESRRTRVGRGRDTPTPDYQLARDWITRLKPYAPLDRLTARTA